MAAQDTYFQAIIDAVNNQTADLKYVLAGPSGIPPLSGTWTVSTVSAQIQRPANTTAYAANQAWADATAVVGGTPLINMARSFGGSGTITDAVFSTSAAAALNGELWLFDQAITATADGSALAVSAADALKLVGVIPFLCTDITSTVAASYVQGLNIGFTCIGSANLRAVVKVMGAVTPASREILSIRLKVQN